MNQLKMIWNDIFVQFILGVNSRKITMFKEANKGTVAKQSKQSRLVSALLIFILLDENGMPFYSTMAGWGH